MARTRPAEWLADHMRSVLPDVAKYGEQSTAEFVQTGVWLVGLASALLGLFLVNDAKLDFISPTSGKWIVSLLGLSVVGGIAQRFFAFISVNREVNARFALWSWLTSYRADVDFADDLEDDWSATDIVDRLKRHYDADLSYMLQRPDALEYLRPLYTTIHENWQKVDREQVEAVIDAGWRLYGMGR